MNNKQSGFGALVPLLAIIIVILLGVIGWLVWSRMQPTSSAQSPASNTSSTKPTINTTDAKNLVTEFYLKYTDGNEDKVTLIKQYGTASLLAAYNNAMSGVVGSDPIVCAQAIAPVSVISATDTSSGADVVVTEAFNTPLDLTVSVVNDNGLKINHVTCPQR